MVLDIAVEVADGRETEHVRQFLNCHIGITQQARDIQCRIAVYPVVRRIAAVFLYSLGEVLARHAEAVGIISQIAVFAELALLQKP